MSRELLPPIPTEMRHRLNFELKNEALSALDDNARFVVRRMVARAYGEGFDAGFIAGQDDAFTDRKIEQDKEAQR